MHSVDLTEQLVKAARDCHTKSQWDAFYDKFGAVLATTAQSKLIIDVFKRLEADPQSLYYNPKLWGALIQGAISSWNMETGMAIAEFTRKLSTPVVSIPAAQVLLDGGRPAQSREYAQRALRLGGLEVLDRIQLDLIVASSFAEEGKTDHAVRVLSKLSPLIHSADMTLKDRADYVIRTGRLQYFMGQYPAAADSFAEAAPIYLRLEDWEGAAKALFNAGACIQNSGTDDGDSATEMVEKCRKLSLEHNLWGPLSHCEAFYGVECYNKGLFSSAKDHFRRAMTVIPASDKSFRRLHILSFLSLTYFAMGRYALAIKFGRQTLDLAATDTSDRFKTRYMALEAEILWEEGKIMESMAVLRQAVHQLSLHGVHNLEELSTLTRYQVQMAILGEVVTEKFKIDDSLQKKQATWLEYQYSCALMRASSSKPEDPVDQLTHLLGMAKTIGSIQYQALSLLAIIRCHLQRGQTDAAQKILPQLESAVSRIGDTPIRAKLQFVYSAIAYQTGDFDGAIKGLHAVDKMSAVSWTDRFAVQTCLATIRGESPRFQHEWQEQLVARFVRGYFAPTIRFNDNREVVISGHYRVSLEKHQAMSDLLVYLTECAPVGAPLADVQQHVWKESLNAQGWQQKIRNSVMRLRDLFPYTIAPIIVHSDHLRFFGEAIRVIREHDDSLSIEIRVRHVLSEGPQSSQNLADKLDVSLATAKRVLKKMVDGRQISCEKSGRNVVYSVASDSVPMH